MTRRPCAWPTTRAHGLNSSVWSADDERAEQIARAIEAGNVCINDCMVSYAVAGLPFGGVKESGIGRIHGVEGLRVFCNTKLCCRQAVRLRRVLPAVPAPGLGHGLAAPDRAPALPPRPACQAAALAQTPSGADLGQDRLGLVDDLVHQVAGGHECVDRPDALAGREELAVGTTPVGGLVAAEVVGAVLDRLQHLGREPLDLLRAPFSYSCV